MRHGPWTIVRSEWLPEFEATHDDYDASWEGEEDGWVSNGLHTSAKTIEGLLKGLTRRVFRYMLDGSLEWAAYEDWRMHHERARFFGFASRDLPASMTS